ncbi:ead/Ea22-like family protein [Escherichia coli]|uniref:ead/Ea22-like family protein n=1 Tax=Escherichia coli TaxID=562 RepID=UPI003D70135D
MTRLTRRFRTSWRPGMTNSTAINYQALREAAQNAKDLGGIKNYKRGEQAVAEFESLITPHIVLGLLDERERNQQYIKRRDQENEDIALTVGKLRVELEAAKSKLNEQREYYDGVIADGSKRIAELEAREIKPAKGEVLVVVSGFTGCGKSAIAGEIEIAMKAIGVPVQWTNGDAEKRMTGADWLTAIEMYKPTVRIMEVNVPRAAGIRTKGDAGEQNDEKP